MFGSVRRGTSRHARHSPMYRSMWGSTWLCDTWLTAAAVHNSTQCDMAAVEYKRVLQVPHGWKHHTAYVATCDASSCTHTHRAQKDDTHLFKPTKTKKDKKPHTYLGHALARSPSSANADCRTSLDESAHADTSSVGSGLPATRGSILARRPSDKPVWVADAQTYRQA